MAAILVVSVFPKSCFNFWSSIFSVEINKVFRLQDVVKPTNEGQSLNSDMSCHDEDEEEDDYDDDDMVEYEDDDDDDCDYYMFENSKEDDEAHYSNMQAQFDNVDLPPGVEASFSWLNDPAPVAASTKLVDPPAEHHNHQIPNIPTDIASTSSNIASTSAGENQDEVKKKFEGFKSFDIVDDFSDHHFNNAGFQGQQVTFGNINSI